MAETLHEIFDDCWPEDGAEQNELEEGAIGELKVNMGRIAKAVHRASLDFANPDRVRSGQGEALFEGLSEHVNQSMVHTGFHIPTTGECFFVSTAFTVPGGFEEAMARAAGRELTQRRIASFFIMPLLPGSYELGSYTYQGMFGLSEDLGFVATAEPLDRRILFFSTDISEDLSNYTPTVSHLQRGTQPMFADNRIIASILDKPLDLRSDDAPTWKASPKMVDQFARVADRVEQFIELD